MPSSDGLRLPSGLAIENPADRLLKFCRNEYAYYDGLPATDPFAIEPLDVLATFSVNSRIGGADRVAAIHTGMAKGCNHLLRQIPPSADLASAQPPLDVVHELIGKAVKVKYVLVPVATKVLHRKRPLLVPMLDNVVMGHYLANGPKSLIAGGQIKPRAADTAMFCLGRVRDDLLGAMAELVHLRALAAQQGFALSLVRVLDILLWTEVEPRGYYR